MPRVQVAVPGQEMTWAPAFGAESPSLYTSDHFIHQSGRDIEQGQVLLLGGANLFKTQSAQQTCEAAQLVTAEIPLRDLDGDRLEIRVSLA